MINVGEPLVDPGLIGDTAVENLCIKSVPVYQIQKLHIDDPSISFLEHADFFD